MTPAEIRTARAAAHRARARDFAESHGIPEAALVAAFTGPGVVAIEAAPDRLMSLVAALGETLALTRNDSAVQERQCRYDRYDHDPAGRRVTGAEIDLLLFPEHWVHAFAVTEQTAKATKRSIQVFDAAGEAVHKIHLTPESDEGAFDRLVEALRLPIQRDHLPLVHPAASATGLPEGAFPGELPGSRPAPARAAGGTGSALAPAAITEVLERAAAGHVPLEIRVGNRGCLQIFRGPVERVLPAGYWINVMDPRFNLHLRTDHLADVRLVAPCGAEGASTVKAFDPVGSLIAAFTADLGAATEWEALAGGLTRL